MPNLTSLLRRPAARLGMAAVAIALLGTAAGSAVAADDAALRVAAQRACAVEMRLDAAAAEYDACVQSLIRTVSTTPAAATPAPAGDERLACAAAGIRPDSPGFAQCVADLRTALWDKRNLGAR